MLIIQGDVFFCTFYHDFNIAHIYMKYLFWVGEICKKETQACKSNRFTKEFQAEWPVLLGRNGLKIYHDVISSNIWLNARTLVSTIISEQGISFEKTSQY